MIRQILMILFAVNTLLIYGQAPANSIVAENGRLQVSGSHVVNANNQLISLAGNSLFWSNFGEGSKYYNDQAVSHLTEDWNTSIVRAAMGVEYQDGYAPNNGLIADQNDEEKDKVKIVVEAAIDNGIYVIIDWHSHHAEDYQQEAIDFFTEMAQLYGAYDNVIYEIYNEPIGTSWSTVKSYSEAVIGAIRSVDPDNLIVVGTPFYSQKVVEASQNPINDVNVAYTLHFYAGTHKQSLRDDAVTAMNNGIALFVTEWGAVNADGDGNVDYAETEAWMNFLRENHISHANWAISDKSEGASAVAPGSGLQGLLNNNLSSNGEYLKEIIKNWNGVPVVQPDNNQPDNNQPVNTNGTDIIVRAKGSCGVEEMQLAINDEIVQTFSNVSTGENAYTYTYGGAINSIKVIFTNNTSHNCDNNLYVNNIEIGGTVYETENIATREGCGTSEWLWCNGYFLYNNINYQPVVEEPAEEEPVVEEPAEEEPVVEEPAEEEPVVEEPAEEEPVVEESSSKIITVRARGNCGAEEMQLAINDNIVQTFSNVSSSENAYTYTYNGGPINSLKVIFTNDASYNCDHNLHVNNIDINGIVYETETTATREGCGISDWLWCNGYFLYEINDHPAEEEPVVEEPVVEEPVVEEPVVEEPAEEEPVVEESSSKSITVRARGNCGAEEMQLAINGNIVQTFSNVSSSENAYTYTYYDGFINSVKVIFTNDAAGNCDHNLYVNHINIDGTVYETETAATRDGCGTPEWLWCNGSFTFNNVNLKTNFLKPNLTLQLHPNPFSGSLLNVSLGELNETNEVELSIYSINGVQVYSTSLTSSKLIQLTNLPNLTTGLYMVTAVSNNLKQVGKLQVR